MDEMQLSKDIGKVAARLGEVEVTLEKFEEYQHTRNHDLGDMVQALQAQRVLDMDKINVKLDAIVTSVAAHKDEENSFFKKVGSALITALGMTTVGLIAYIWHLVTGK